VDPSALDNLPSRPQSSNAAFTTHRTYPFRECFEGPGEPFSSYCTSFRSQQGTRTFTDAQGWYPGLEYRPDLNPDNPLFFRDADASVVLPSVDSQPYTVAIVDADGNLVEDQFGIDLGGGVLTGTGNPGDDGVAFGVEIKLLWPGLHNKWATVRVTPVPLA
jgi:immune inhibitor A